MSLKGSSPGHGCAAILTWEFSSLGQTAGDSHLSWLIVLLQAWLCGPAKTAKTTASLLAEMQTWFEVMTSTLTSALLSVGFDTAFGINRRVAQTFQHLFTRV